MSDYINVKVCKFQINESLNRSKLCGTENKVAVEDLIDVVDLQKVSQRLIYLIYNFISNI